MKTRNTTYLILTIILLILSGIGGYFLFQNFQNQNSSNYTSDSIPKIELIPTDTALPQDEVNEEDIGFSDSTSSAQISITPIATASVTKITTPTKIPTKIPTLTTTITPTISTSGLTSYSSSEDNFSVSYSSKRQLVAGTESTGNRYTFAYSTGNFAIHVSDSGTWSWTHTGRQFSTAFVVSGQPTFRYDIAAQTIVDLQSSDKNYTIQCVHNGSESLKAECESFISSFKLL